MAASPSARASFRRMPNSAMAAAKPIVILGVFVADTAYRAERPPRMGETILGTGFALGPGGKGSNQAVAAARLGADVSFITRLGKDPFADMAMKTWANAGESRRDRDARQPYGCGLHLCRRAPAARDHRGARRCLADLACRYRRECGIDPFGLGVRDAARTAARRGNPRAGDCQTGVTTILNAPAAALPDPIYRLCDYVTPNETEAEGITGVAVSSVEGCARPRTRVPPQGRRRSDHHARREGRAASHGEVVGTGRGL